MTEQYQSQCWNCKSRDIEDKGDYVQCRSCGATYNPIAKTDRPLLEAGNVVHIIEGEPISSRAKHPSAGVKRRAAKARRAVT